VSEDAQRPDRRIGERIVIEPIEVVWAVVENVPQGRLRRKKPAITGRPGHVIDVSVTGAAIAGPAHPDLVTGAKAVIVFDHGRSEVRIKRCVPTKDPEVVRYGVEYEHLDAALREAIFTAVGRDRPGEQAWRRAW
jgi:PilZ domain